MRGVLLFDLGHMRSNLLLAPVLGLTFPPCLQVDWQALSSLREGRLSVIGNLPYHITSQILFCLLDNHEAVSQAVVTMQWEVAQRIVSPPRCALMQFSDSLMPGVVRVQEWFSDSQM
jgi:16S rRNA A1518/A1519 N6-dimethyltransferase RsmA/KsgA/DIM1 with predicted DNA glycosylase/AP lyase activity